MFNKTNIELVTGFLDCGKTTFINSLLSKTLIKSEKIVILLFENGEEKIDEKYSLDSNIAIEYFPPTKEINFKLLNYFRRKYHPNRIIIEFNGSRDLNELLPMVNSKDFKRVFKIKEIVNIIDSKLFPIYLNNMGSIITSPIKHGNIILINNKSKVSYESLNNIKKTIKLLNRKAYIIDFESVSNLNSKMKKSSLFYKDFFTILQILTKDSKEIQR